MKRRRIRLHSGELLIYGVKILSPHVLREHAFHILFLHVPVYTFKATKFLSKTLEPSLYFLRQHKQAQTVYCQPAFIPCSVVSLHL